VSGSFSWFSCIRADTYHCKVQVKIQM
jgi:hypothetical protein